MTKPTTCTVAGCDRDVRCKGLCSVHYYRVRRRGTTDLPTPKPRSCAVPDCERPREYADHCHLHYRRLLRHGSTSLPVPDRRICNVEGCTSPGTGGKGYCNKHYKRFRAHGDPLHVEPPRKGRGVPVESRFWRYVSTGAADQCWEWEGARNRQGYGLLKRADGKQLRASRVSYEIHHGPIPSGLMICHTCDNPPCVNPAHIYAGTAFDNARDRARALGQR